VFFRTGVLSYRALLVAALSKRTRKRRPFALLAQDGANAPPQQRQPPVFASTNLA